MSKIYHVFGGYRTETTFTESYEEALQDFLSRIRHTKPKTNARIGMVSGWKDSDGMIHTEVEQLVILPSDGMLRFLNDLSRVAREMKEIQQKELEDYLDNSPEYYKMKYD